MATHRAVAAIGQTLVGLLKDNRLRPDFDSCDFELYQSNNFASPMAVGLSLYLHRVAISTARRNLPPRQTLDGKRFRPSLPLDLHFLLTAWARSAPLQYQLLAWAMRLFEDYPILTASLMNHYSPDTFSFDETVDVVFEPMTVQDMGTVWEVAKPNVQISANYAIRMVLIDSNLEISDAELVQTRVLTSELKGGR